MSPRWNAVQMFQIRCGWISCACKRTCSYQTMQVGYANPHQLRSHCHGSVMKHSHRIDGRFPIMWCNVTFDRLVQCAPLEMLLLSNCWLHCLMTFCWTLGLLCILITAEYFHLPCSPHEARRALGCRPWAVPHKQLLEPTGSLEKKGKQSRI